MNKYKVLILNVTLILVTTAIIEMTFHEIGHFITAYFFDAKNLSLHHNFVNYDADTLTLQQRISIAAAGPIVSLLFGIIFHFITIKSKERNTLFLFNLFLCIHGYIGFFGYLMIAPLSTSGDTGYIFNAFGFPVWLVIIIAVLGIYILIKLLKLLTKYYIQIIDKTSLENFEERKFVVAALIKFPVYISVILLILINLPVPIWLSVLPAFSIFSLFSGYGIALHNNIVQPNSSEEFNKLNRLQPILILIFIAIIIVNRLLVAGYSIH